MEFDWVMGCVFRWFVGPKILLCNGMGWVGSVVWWVGLKKVNTRITLTPLVLTGRDVDRLL